MVEKHAADAFVSLGAAMSRSGPRSGIDRPFTIAQQQGPSRLPSAPLVVRGPGTHAGRQPRWARKKAWFNAGLHTGPTNPEREF